jgi:hypothetical protein
VLQHTSAVGIPASCSLIIPIIWASVKRLCRMCLLLRRLSKLYIKVREVSGSRSIATAAAQIAAAVLRAIGSIIILLGPIPTAANCSTTTNHKSEPATNDNRSNPAPDMRRAEDWKRLSSLINCTNCFGCDLRDNGHRRVPDTPHKRNGSMQFFISTLSFIYTFKRCRR